MKEAIVLKIKFYSDDLRGNEILGSKQNFIGSSKVQNINELFFLSRLSHSNISEVLVLISSNLEYKSFENEGLY